MIMKWQNLILVGILISFLLSLVIADSSDYLISDNFTGSDYNAASNTEDTAPPTLRPTAVISWSDVTMVSGKIRNFQKEFRYESGFTRE